MRFPRLASAYGNEISLLCAELGISYVFRIGAIYFLVFEIKLRQRTRGFVIDTYEKEMVEDCANIA